MQLTIVAFAIPIFLLFIAIEYWVVQKKKLPYYHLHSSIANISIGLAERLADVFVAGMFYFVYKYLQTNYGLFHIESGILLFLALLLITDFVWYWYHRLAHEINILWAVHIVHHQSEDFNYTASARITVLQSFVRTGFWCVLPILGFPAEMITTVLIIHGTYPFFTHTRVIKKLGILEYVLVTPSHHRVHHASNEKYLDKNYGDVFIIWDKLFGTFKKEEEEPVYGLTHPLKTYSFLWQHFHYFIELIVETKKKKGILNKLKVFFAKPNIVSIEARKEAEILFSIKRNEGHLNQPLNTYVVWQMLILVSCLFGFVLFEHQLSLFVKIVFACLVILTLINCGALMEQKKWIFSVELIRFSVLSVAIVYSVGFASVSKYSALMIAGLLLTWYYKFLEEKYLRLVYRNQLQETI